MINREVAFEETALALDFGTWTIDFGRDAVHWPRGLGLENAKRRYVWSPLAEVAGYYVEAERARFLGYLAELLGAPGVDRTIDLVAKAPGGGRTMLRLAGRAVREEGVTLALGVVQCLDKLRDAEILAKGVTGILEAVFIATDSGVVVLDERLHVRRINRAAIRMFGLEAGEGPLKESMAAVQAMLPAEILESLAESVRRRAAVAGTVVLPSSPTPHGWRANPYGRGDHGLNGAVLLIAPPSAAAPPAPVVADDQGFRVLEHLRDPIVVVTMQTARIRFANQAGRQLLRMNEAHRYWVKNLYDLTRHLTRYQPPRDQAGHLPVTLPLGARVTRLTENGDDLMMFEYVYR